MAIGAGLHQLVEPARAVEQPETRLGIDPGAVAEVTVLAVIARLETPLVEITAHLVAILVAGRGTGHQIPTVVQLLDGSGYAQAVGAGRILKLDRVAVIDHGKGGAQLAIHLVTDPILRTSPRAVTRPSTSELVT